MNFAYRKENLGYGSFSFRGERVSHSSDGPHAKRGRLRNGNPACDCCNAPRCGAKTRRGTRCMGPAMSNRRCRLHGGCSTGPKTPDGLERSRKARWKHGRRSQHARKIRRGLAEAGRVIRVLQNYDRLYRLLMRIAAQLDTIEASGLAMNCRRALRYWQPYLKVLNSSPTGDKSDTANAGDRIITGMLELGAAGEPPNRIRAILRGHVNLSTGCEWLTAPHGAGHFR
jgi:hypothetical protein